ncbi:hypothetical protein PR048_023086 [Dryococelus australis]|uniref:Uncharacterized protein n=1 Tax=Dryococelus australis TaxID=614101 RepID=A0ABQ9GT27_9NEOP|nr:hypothetical protein PR048_023086 [Dryococelus australis]
MQLVSGSSRGYPVSPVPSFRRHAIFTSITLIGSQDLAVKSRPNIFTRSRLQRVFNMLPMHVSASDKSSPQRLANALEQSRIIIHLLENLYNPTLQLFRCGNVCCIEKYICNYFYLGSRSGQCPHFESRKAHRVWLRLVSWVHSRPVGGVYFNLSSYDQSPIPTNVGAVPLYQRLQITPQRRERKKIMTAEQQIVRVKVKNHFHLDPRWRLGDITTAYPTSRCPWRPQILLDLPSYIRTMNEKLKGRMKRGEGWLDEVEGRNVNDEGRLEVEDAGHAQWRRSDMYRSHGPPERLSLTRNTRHRQGRANLFVSPSSQFPQRRAAPRAREGEKQTNTPNVAPSNDKERPRPYRARAYKRPTCPPSLVDGVGPTARVHSSTRFVLGSSWASVVLRCPQLALRTFQVRLTLRTVSYPLFIVANRPGTEPGSPKVGSPLPPPEYCHNQLQAPPTSDPLTSNPIGRRAANQKRERTVVEGRKSVLRSQPRDPFACKVGSGYKVKILDNAPARSMTLFGNPRCPPNVCVFIQMSFNPLLFRFHVRDLLVFRKKPLRPIRSQSGRGVWMAEMPNYMVLRRPLPPSSKEAIVATRQYNDRTLSRAEPGSNCSNLKSNACRFRWSGWQTSSSMLAARSYLICSSVAARLCCPPAVGIHLAGAGAATSARLPEYLPACLNLPLHALCSSPTPCVRNLPHNTPAGCSMSSWHHCAEGAKLVTPPPPADSPKLSSHPCSKVVKTALSPCQFSRSPLWTCTSFFVTSNNLLSVLGDLELFMFGGASFDMDVPILRMAARVSEVSRLCDWLLRSAEDSLLAGPPADWPMAFQNLAGVGAPHEDSQSGGPKFEPRSSHLTFMIYRNHPRRILGVSGRQLLTDATVPAHTMESDRRAGARLNSHFRLRSVSGVYSMDASALRHLSPRKCSPPKFRGPPAKALRMRVPTRIDAYTTQTWYRLFLTDPLVTSEGAFALVALANVVAFLAGPNNRWADSMSHAVWTCHLRHYLHPRHTATRYCNDTLAGGCDVTTASVHNVGKYTSLTDVTSVNDNLRFPRVGRNDARKYTSRLSGRHSVTYVHLWSHWRSIPTCCTVHVVLRSHWRGLLDQDGILQPRGCREPVPPTFISDLLSGEQSATADTVRRLVTAGLGNSPLRAPPGWRIECVAELRRAPCRRLACSANTPGPGRGTEKAWLEGWTNRADESTITSPLVPGPQLEGGNAQCVCAGRCREGCLQHRRLPSPSRRMGTCYCGSTAVLMFATRPNGLGRDGSRASGNATEQLRMAEVKQPLVPGELQQHTSATGHQHVGTLLASLCQSTSQPVGTANQTRPLPEPRAGNRRTTTPFNFSVVSPGCYEHARAAAEFLAD